jgi:hypothetical protein
MEAGNNINDGHAVEMGMREAWVEILDIGLVET